MAQSVEPVVAPATVLEVRKVTRRFGGLVAVSEVDFTIQEKSIGNLIGPNGAARRSSAIWPVPPDLQ
jgi:ABC-type branched-subunit amino acid transport system ATPase component